jgi:hypothetical protein
MTAKVCAALAWVAVTGWSAQSAEEGAPVYRSYQAMAAATAVSNRATAVTAGPLTHCFGYYDKAQLDASHYIWRDPEHVLIWANGAYRLYRDDGSGEPKETLWQAPNGHQSYIPGTQNAWLVTDTYDRSLYLVHLPTGSFVPLGRYPQDKAYTGEWRCDLHPRVSRDGRWVFFDSPHAGNGRQLYRVDISNLLRPCAHGGRVLK